MIAKPISVVCQSLSTIFFLKPFMVGFE
jgi:hypothetical protein